MQNLLKIIPSVDVILKDEAIALFPLDSFSKKNVVQLSLAQIRANILAKTTVSITKEEVISYVLCALKNHQNNLVRVINATGTILHTNLGRSPLAKSAIQNMINLASGYSNLEYDIEHQKRGDREQTLVHLLAKLTGCEDACVVNNNASAVFITLNSLSKGKKVIVARGENVEIGGSFRIPEIIRASGAKIIDIGTTNKTYKSDYQTALENEKNANMMLKIHTSNYEINGFTKSATITELASLKDEKTFLVEDQGSGTIIDLSHFSPLPPMATVKQSILEGADLVLFSGDKLLGSVQAGIIVGKKDLIAKIKKNQMFRMLRTSKVISAALEATLRLYQDESIARQEVPTLRMITESPEQVKLRAKRFLQLVQNKSYQFDLIPTKAVIGGGSLPNCTIDSFGVVVKKTNVKGNELRQQLTKMAIPIIGLAKEKDVILDFKAIQDDEIEMLARCFNENN